MAQMEVRGIKLGQDTLGGLQLQYRRRYYATSMICDVMVEVVDGEEKDWPLEMVLMEMVGEAEGVSVALLDWCELEDELVLVMERPVPCMDLLKYTKSKGGFLEEEEAKVILKQLVEGMISIHSKGVLHRDLKPENILVQMDPEGPRVRVLDFGCGCFLKEDPYSSYWDFGGTLYYSPPEWFLQGSIQPSTVWQIGVVLYGMLTGLVPFRFSTEIVYNDFYRPAHLSPEAEGLIKSCLDKQPQRRPSLCDILQHPWLQ